MRLWRRLTAGALVALALVSVPATASAAPDQDSLDDVVSALKVARKPSDYVIVVDTSGSMTTDGRYAKVKTALRSLLQELKPDDHVSLVTFDTGAKVLYRGNISKGRYGALEALPVTPTGDLTDIGAGISAGLGELEAPGAKDLGALVLITDGKLDTAEGSDYRTADSAGWSKLRKRAEAISAKHQIAGYAIALESAADAALLKKVLPKATDIPAKDIDERLSELDSALVRFQAAQRLQPDLEHGVEASWSGELTDLPESGGSTTAEVTLTSTYERIPVEVSDLARLHRGRPHRDCHRAPRCRHAETRGEPDHSRRTGHRRRRLGSTRLVRRRFQPLEECHDKDLGTRLRAHLDVRDSDQRHRADPDPDADAVTER